MNHFLEISELSRPDIERLLQRALFFKKEKTHPSFAGHRLANLFYENSTRTRVSFELAAQHLSIPVVNLDMAASSERKGEIIEDTLKNLVAMGIDLFVIRHKEEGVQQRLAEHLGGAVHLINAGDGTHAHPSQAMLDLMTILENKPDISQLKIAIVGNIRHSRVANSLQCLFSLMGVKELILVAPDVWLPKTVHFGSTTTSFREGITDADVVITLRVQHERLSEDDHMDLQTYRNNYALTRQTLRYAKPDAMVMHPGPVNRGVEIDSDVADGSQSFILQQVKNGVFMRMAIIETLLSNDRL
ncbi:MAG: aspartate carbamoyltransferase catalytic subunit [Legionella sp.]|nr:aspartate carbamoyltransferase catalytic subunit [Legionella sp.]